MSRIDGTNIIYIIYKQVIKLRSSRTWSVIVSHYDAAFGDWKIVKRASRNKEHERYTLARYAIYVQSNNDWLHSCPRCPAWTGHEPYHIALRSMSDSATFFQIISQTTRFSGGGAGKLLNTNSVLIFSKTLVWNVAHSKKSARYYHKCTQVVM